MAATTLGADQDHADADHGINRITPPVRALIKRMIPGVTRASTFTTIEPTSTSINSRRWGQEGAYQAQLKRCSLLSGRDVAGGSAGVVLLRLDHIDIQREWSELRVEQAQLAVFANAIQQDVTLVEEHRRTWTRLSCWIGSSTIDTERSRPLSSWPILIRLSWL